MTKHRSQKFRMEWYAKYQCWWIVNDWLFVNYDPPEKAQVSAFLRQLNERNALPRVLKGLNCRGAA